MSFKKISVILLALIMLIPAFGAYASDASLNITADHAEKSIDLEYTNADCAYILCGIAIVDSDTDSLLYYTQQKTSRTGKINLNKIKIGDYGSYNVTVTPVTGQPSSKAVVYILGDSDIDTLWTLITSSANPTALKTDWGKIKAAFGINEKYAKDIDTFMTIVAADSDIKSLSEKNAANIALLNEYIAPEEAFAAADYLDDTAELDTAKAVIKESYSFISAKDNAFFNELRALETSDNQLFENAVMKFAGADKDISDIDDIIALLKSSIKDAKADKIISRIKSITHESEIYTILTETGNDEILGIEADIVKYKNLTATAVADEYIRSASFSNSAEFAAEFNKAVSKALTAQNNPPSPPKSPNNSTRPGNGVGAIGNSGETPSVPDTKDRFKDMQGYEWADGAVNKLADMGIINGYGDNTYRPSAFLTRAEFVKIIMSFAKGLTPSDTDISFADVKPGDWFADYAINAAKAGIVKGDGANFNPNMGITRQDSAVIIARLVAENGISLSGSKSFTDSMHIADYAKEAVSSLAYSGIINGFEDGSFAPAKNITRAEAAVMISRLIANFPVAEVK